MAENDNIEFERLLDWVEGRLSEEEAREVEKVAMADESIRAEAEWLRAFVQMSEKTTLDKPPPEIREELARRFRSYAEEQRRPGFFERIVATLTFDSNARMAVAGFRSAGGSEFLPAARLRRGGRRDSAKHPRPPKQRARRRLRPDLPRRRRRSRCLQRPAPQRRGRDRPHRCR